MSLVLVRHGETEWSRDHRHTGRTDVPLTDRGREEALALRQPLRSWDFAAVFCSPLQRARDTCALAGFGEVAVADADLLEWDYGECEGLTTAQIRERTPGWNLWDGGTPGGESIAEVARRAQRVLDRVRVVDADVLLVAHGHVLRILAALWLELRPVDGRHLQLDPASPCVLGHEYEWSTVQRWNLPAG